MYMTRRPAELRGGCRSPSQPTPPPADPRGGPIEYRQPVGDPIVGGHRRRGRVVVQTREPARLEILTHQGGSILLSRHQPRRHRPPGLPPGDRSRAGLRLLPPRRRRRRPHLALRQDRPAPHPEPARRRAGHRALPLGRRHARHAPPDDRGVHRPHGRPAAGRPADRRAGPLDRPPAGDAGAAGGQRRRGRPGQGAVQRRRGRLRHVPQRRR